MDTRIVCATHRNLKRMILDGSFREDLFYRIAEVTISIPHLRDRDGDAVLLANHFLRKFSASRPGPPLRFGPDAIAAMNLHSWPGNVRELENRVKRAAIMVDGNIISAIDLDLADQADAAIPTLREARMVADRRTIGAALTASAGSISKAAKILGISRPTLYDMVRELEIELP